MRSNSHGFCLVLATALIALLVGCSGGGGGGGIVPIPPSDGGGCVPEVEPNNTAAEATAIALNECGRGNVHEAGDLDYWAISLMSGSVIQVELFATRVDQATWAARSNVPRLTLLNTDGVSKLLEHDPSGNVGAPWAWGSHDLDFGCFTVPVTGTYFICVTQDNPQSGGGAYVLRTSLTRTFVTQVESEFEGGNTSSNDTPGSAEAITPGVIRGFHVDDENDYFSFTALQPSIVVFELKSYRMGHFGGDDEYFNGELEVYQPDGTTSIAYGDDQFFSDPGVSVILGLPGTYYIRVGECCDDGDAEYYLTYTLLNAMGALAEAEPNDSPATATPMTYGGIMTGSSGAGDDDFFSFSGSAGDMVRVLWFDSTNDSAAASDVTPVFIDTDGTTTLPSDSSSDGIPNVRTILQTTGTFFVHVAPSAMPTSYGFQLELFNSAGYETEPNDLISQSNPIDPDSRRAAGLIDVGTDADYFSFAAVAKELVTIVAYASDTVASSGVNFDGHGSDLVPTLTIQDDQGATLATSHQSSSRSTESSVDGLPSSQVTFSAPSAGTYHVRVTDRLGTGSAAHYYVIERRTREHIFVSALGGAPGNPGTRDEPLRSISAGYALAKSVGAPGVTVSVGAYDETPVFDSTIEVRGGYDPVSWTRLSGYYSVVNVNSTGLKARDIASQVSISGLDVRAANAAPFVGMSGSSVALDVRNCAKNLLFEDCLFNAGLGADGASGTSALTAGASGGQGSAGDAGIPFTVATILIGTVFEIFDGAAGGPGATMPPGGEAGGDGGDGGGIVFSIPALITPSDGLSGGSGTGPCVNGGTGGAAGTIPVGLGCLNGADGGDGTAGADGVNGINGLPASSVGGFVAGGDWSADSATNGTAGVAGCGGGGAGGGGAFFCLIPPPWGNGFQGGGGGGGGAGGGPGSFGTGGTDGGGSLAVYLFDASPTFHACSFVAGLGGAGGSGGDGSSGGYGGSGGPGGIGFALNISLTVAGLGVTYDVESGHGGNGGQGGRGGGGGGGGGGHGGPSWCVLKAGSSFPAGLEDESNVFVEGSGGASGQGGFEGNSQAQAPSGKNGPVGQIGSL